MEAAFNIYEDDSRVQLQNYNLALEWFHKKYQPARAKKMKQKTLKLLFWKVWLLDAVMHRDRALVAVAPACNAHGSRSAPASAGALGRLLPALMSSGPAWMWLNCHQSG